MLVLYVDDVLYAGELSVLNRFEAFMKAKFELRLTNEAKYFIGFQIEQKGDYILVHQTKYIQDIVKKLDLCNAAKENVPFVESTKFVDGSPVLKDKKIFSAHSRMFVVHLYKY